MFLQTFLEGSNININKIKATLNTFGQYVRAARKQMDSAEEKSQDSCKKDIRAVKSRFHDMTLRTVAVKRELDSTERIIKRRGLALKRASQEAGHYVKFAAMARSSAKAWGKFWASGEKVLSTIEKLLSRFSQQLEHIAPSAAALVELPDTYTSALTELSETLENTYDNLHGMKPIIENLVEIAKKPANLRVKEVHASIVKMAHMLIGRFHDFMNLISEENEHQEGIFEGLSQLFGDASKRANGIVTQLEGEQGRAAKKAAWLRQGVSGSEHLAQGARNIVDLFMHQCAAFQQHVHNSEVRFTRFLNVIGQLQEVIADRWGSLHGFFLQKFDNLEADNKEQ
jgi:hypothetical protein